MRAIRIHRHGGTEVLQLDVLEPASLAPNQVLVEIAYAGVNFVDSYQRLGRYPGIRLPMALGVEASGVVRAIGNEVTNHSFAIGTRVCFAGNVQGTYADHIAVDPADLIVVPDDISLLEAACGIEQGLTASVLLQDVVHPRLLLPNTSALVHAAATGVGRWLVLWLKARKLHVIGLASTENKRAWLSAQGVSAIANSQDNWPELVLASNDNTPIKLIFDSIGKDTFAQSLALLANAGHLVLFGAASGPVEQVSIAELMAKSASLSRPRVGHFCTGPQLQEHAERCFALLREHRSSLADPLVFGLAQAADAHHALADRHRSQKIILSINPQQ